MCKTGSLPSFVYIALCFYILKGGCFMIGTTLKKMRNIYGLTATELSKQLKISNSYLSEIENGVKQPSLEILQKYSDIMGIKLSSLILLSEQYDEANRSGKGQDFIKNLMMKLINTMSKDVTENN